MLSDRRQRVLCALIEEYIRHAVPVGSRTLTERYSLGVSPATVRNDLSALEDGGFIFQPHTSAGRVPTDYGYRAFVDELLESDWVQEENPHPDVVSQLRQRAGELDELMEQTSEALMRLTNCLSIVCGSFVSAGAHPPNLPHIPLASAGAGGDRGPRRRSAEPPYRLRGRSAHRPVGGCARAYEPDVCGEEPGHDGRGGPGRGCCPDGRPLVPGDIGRNGGLHPRVR